MKVAIIYNKDLTRVINQFGMQNKETYGESRYTHLPSMLEMLGIPYVGSSPAGPKSFTGEPLRNGLTRTCGKKADL